MTLYAEFELFHICFHINMVRIHLKAENSYVFINLFSPSFRFIFLKNNYAYLFLYLDKTKSVFL